MRIRLVLSFCAIAGMLALPFSAAAEDGEYECRESQLLGIDPGAIIADGPSCSFVVTCPDNASQCIVTANGFATGIGDVGVAVLIGQGPETQCGGLLSCGTGDISRTLGPGDQVTVLATWFSQGTTIGVLARVAGRATRVDS